MLFWSLERDIIHFYIYICLKKGFYLMTSTHSMWWCEAAFVMHHCICSSSTLTKRVGGLAPYVSLKYHPNFSLISCLRKIATLESNLTMSETTQIFGFRGVRNSRVLRTEYCKAYSPPSPVLRKGRGPLFSGKGGFSLSHCPHCPPAFVQEG